AAAEQVAGTCPGQARFLLVPAWSSLQTCNECGFERICPYCFQFLVPDSCRVRLKPKMKVTPQIEKVLKQEAKNCKLNMKQTKLLRKYRESRSLLLVTCNSCNKTRRLFGKSRTTKTYSSGTPNSKSSLRTPDVKLLSSNKVTPVSCRRLGSKGNSPSPFLRTCVSREETASSASKTPRNSKFHFSRLKQMLNLEEKDKRQKTDLKTFLTYL
ncbi:CR021 protein, partial [Eubucco bourcierii]|nr:CR021 protein [Eubucco bourcierii]